MKKIYDGAMKRIAAAVVAAARTAKRTAAAVVAAAIAAFGAVEAKADTYPTSGTCGEGLEWKLENGKFTISGDGTTMDNYSSRQDVPWHYYTSTEVVLVDAPNLTNISNYAFHDFGNLKSVTLPDSIMTIGDYSFYNCSELPSILMPRSLVSIGNQAFRRCGSLSLISMPNSVTVIGSGCFDECWALEKVAIGRNIKSIGDLAFVSGHLKEAIVWRLSRQQPVAPYSLIKVLKSSS